MKSDQQTIVDSLFQALTAEVDGHHFYLMAARSTEDTQGREVFEMLAREELDHQRFLKAQYQAIVDTGHPSSSVKLGPRSDLAGESPIFSPSIKTRVKDAHFEMSALSIGIQLELNSMNYYRTCASSTPDLEVKAFFQELARWETGHYEALLRQYENLKGDYWSAGRFSPF